MRLGVALPLVPLIRLLPFITLLSPPLAQAAHLKPDTSQAWEEYLDAAHTRMQQRLTPGTPFLWVDEQPDLLARVRSGEIAIAPMGPQIPKRIPSGLIHDWVGAVFIPGVSLNDVLQVVRDYARYKELYQPSVIDSKVLAAGGDRDRFSMLLRNKSLLLKTAFDADYESVYVQLDEHRVYSISRTTRVQEVTDYGSPAERALQEGEGNGIIWRLSGITRYIERDGGVYVELEALGLSRDIPGAIRFLVEPTVRRISRSSLLTSLQQTQNAARQRAETAKAKTGGWITISASGGDASRIHSSPTLDMGLKILKVGP